MDDYLNRMFLHLYFILSRKTTGGWTGSRKNLSAHTLYWIHDGEGTFVGKETQAVSSGSLLYAPPYLDVQYRSSDTNPMEFTIIRFECMTPETDSGNWTLQPVPHLGLPFFMQTDSVDRILLEDWMEGMIKHWNPASQGGEVRSKAALSEILLHIRKDLLTVNEKSTRVIFERIKETMQLHYNRSLSVESLSRQYQLSPVYLRKLFHAYEGCSPKKYLETVRHQHAVRLLLHSELSLRTIAEACGYSDEFHFSKTFKKATGLTPTYYRREHSTAFMERP